MGLTGDDRAVILGGLIWMADKLQSDERDRAPASWAGKGNAAFAAEGSPHAQTITPDTIAGSGVTDGGRRGDPTYRSAARHHVDSLGLRGVVVVQ